MASMVDSVCLFVRGHEPEAIIYCPLVAKRLQVNFEEKVTYGKSSTVE